MTPDPDLVIPRDPSLRADLRKAASSLDINEIEYVVSLYYQLQDFRIASQNRQRAAIANKEPHETVMRLANHFHDLEKAIPPALDKFLISKPEGQWLHAVYGLGPVLGAGLMAILTTGPFPNYPTSWYRYAGLAPGQRRQKGKKLDYHPGLKTLLWKCGDSFVKFHKREECFYGRLYAQRKTYEVANNEAGKYEAQAAQSLIEREIKDADLRATYESGKLPDGRIDLRARRWATKMLLSHFHYVCYRLKFDMIPPRPYAIAHLRHSDWIAPPHLDVLGWPPDEGKP